MCLLLKIILGFLLVAVGIVAVVIIPALFVSGNESRAEELREVKDLERVLDIMDAGGPDFMLSKEGDFTMETDDKYIRETKGKNQVVEEIRRDVDDMGKDAVSVNIGIEDWAAPLVSKINEALVEMTDSGESVADMQRLAGDIGRLIARRAVRVEVEPKR